MPLAKPETKTILVVDDDNNIREFFEMLLNKEGFETVTSHSGTDALNLLRSDSYNQFDLVILDLMMPGRGGYDVLKELQSGQYQNVPIYIVTARVMDPGAVQLIKEESNVQGFWSKPIDSKDFKRKIHILLGTQPKNP